MGDEFFVQFALSAAAVSVLVALAAWAKIAKPVSPLDDARARDLLAQEFPGRAIDALWVGSDGTGAVAKSGGLALILCRVGDGFAARQTPWAQAVSSTFRNGRLAVDLSDIGAPRVVIALPAWPPRSFDGDLAA